MTHACAAPDPTCYRCQLNEDEVDTCGHCGGDVRDSEHFRYGAGVTCLNVKDARRGYESMPEVTAQDARDVIDYARCTRCGTFRCDYCR